MSQVKTSNLKLYRHYKNKSYKYIGEARHSESLDELVLYEARYRNELGSLWVRPKEIFFENLEIDGKVQPRFKQVEIRTETTEKILNQNKDDITELLRLVFGNYNREKLDSRLTDKSKVLLISAFDDQKFVAFKLGYQLNRKTFYSWLGAIHPEYRGIGLGKEFMTFQHAWCRENGYEVVETKTMNSWPAMLVLNIQNGFEIIGIEKNSSGNEKILMRKTLNTCVNGAG